MGPFRDSKMQSPKPETLKLSPSFDAKPQACCTSRKTPECLGLLENSGKVTRTLVPTDQKKAEGTPAMALGLVVSGSVPAIHP